MQHMEIETPLCGWAVEYPGRWVEYEDEETGEYFGDYIEGGVRDCGAHVIFTDRGWSCEAGHSYVSMEARHREGWEYAEDADEARGMMAAGVEPRDLRDGGAFQW